MTAKIIDGKAVSDKIRQEISEKISKLDKKPGLAVVLVGDDPASEVYTRLKGKACEQVGFVSEKYALPEETTQKELIDLIEKLNNNPSIHGILVQLPLPKHLDEDEVINSISPDKDVDGFHALNTGKLMIGHNYLVAATPLGIMQLLESENIDIQGKDAVIVGRSNIVGKPMALLLLQKSATVTICHSKTKDLAEHTRRADILIVAVGKPRLIIGDMVKPAVVIDVGTTKVEEKIVGDVDFDSVKEIAGAVTPVPGGVGPMTITALLKNTIDAYSKIEGVDL